MENKTKPLSEITDTRPARLWQKDFFNRFFAMMQWIFLLVACPGSGKTVAVCRVVRRLFEEGRIDRVVVTVHTEHLKGQWARALAGFGIDIDHTFQNGHGREAPGYHGVALTYQQVAAAPQLHRLNCQQSRTVLIADEPHHSGRDLSWGNAMQISFDAAGLIILATGTPFRSDENQISFVTYENGQSKPDFSYTYGDALADGACRPVEFSVYDGCCAWFRQNGQEVEHLMSDDVSQEKTAEMLQVALASTGDWIPAVLRVSNNKLKEKQANGHPNAAGIIFAKDIAHARAYAKILLRETGERAVIVTSDDENASELIERFKNSTTENWIIAVRMVTEGVDLPRLRVAVFATNTSTELSFRQAIGRITRIVPGVDEQTATMYLPYEPTLIRHAMSIREERNHTLQLKQAANINGQNVAGTSLNHNPAHLFPPEFPGDPGFPDVFEDYGADDDSDAATDDGSGTVSGVPAVNEAASAATGGAEPDTPFVRFKGIIPISSEAIEHNTILNSEQFSVAEIAQAEAVRRQVKVMIPPSQIAAILRAGLSNSTVSGMAAMSPQNSVPAAAFAAGQSTATAPAKTQSMTLSERKDALRGTIRDLANKLARMKGVDFDVVHRGWIEKMNGQRSSVATEEDLIRKLNWIKEKISDVQRRNYRGQRN